MKTIFALGLLSFSLSSFALGTCTIGRGFNKTDYWTVNKPECIQLAAHLYQNAENLDQKIRVRYLRCPMGPGICKVTFNKKLPIYKIIELAEQQ